MVDLEEDVIDLDESSGDLRTMPAERTLFAKRLCDMKK